MKRLLSVSLLLAFCSIAVQADPVQIQAGSIGFSFSVPNSFVLSFGGQGFSVNGHGQSSSLHTPATGAFFMQPGQVLSLSSSPNLTWASDFNAGSLSLSGTNYSLSLNGVVNFRIIAGNVTIPDTVENSITLTAPFQLDRGGAAVFVQQQGQLFSVSFVGSGLATLVMTRHGDTNLFNFSSIRYVFSAPEPIPEPTTLVLLATGLAFVLRLRAHSRPPT